MRVVKLLIFVFFYYFSTVFCDCSDIVVFFICHFIPIVFIVPSGNSFCIGCARRIYMPW
jgi:hypothetical protein